MHHRKISLSITAPPSSLTSTTMSNLDRKTGLRKVLINVIVTSIALTLSCFGYLASCIGEFVFRG